MTSHCHANIKWIRSLILVLALSTNHVLAIEINSGHLQGSIDTTLSYGHLYRVQNRASNLTGSANGGTARTVNGDDGNINYNSGLVSNTAKFTTELDLSYKSSGIFVRGFGFSDGKADDTVRTALDPDAERLVKSNLVLRDAYFWHEFDIGQMPAEFRIGEQVLSWGESTFIQNSINTINPVDVSSIRTPGAELREALVPVGMVYGSLGLTDNISLETYYQYDWEQTVIDPTGSYFSTNDFAGDGGTFIVGAGAGAIGDYIGAGLTPTTNILAAAFGGLTGPQVTATRAANLEPGNGGEFGTALRLYVPELNDTEFGVYFIKYHSRLPIINAIVGTTPGTLDNAQYQLSFPEDIKLYGLSFNTQLGQSGIALQGEYSFRQDVPLQIDDIEILAAALDNAGVVSQVTNTPGGFNPGDFIQGHVEKNVSQFQMTATKVFGQVLKADQAILLGEWAITHIHNMPSKSTLRLEAPGTATTGNAAHIGVLTGHVLEDAGNFADSTSWGYRIAGRLEYNNALFGAVNLQPRFAWQHDVSGNTPGPGGNFVQDRKILSLGVKAIYQNQWEADLSYTSYLGSNRHHLLHDRDFTAFSIKYSF
jgi:Protein of unknown function (DUF1302)